MTDTIGTPPPLPPVKKNNTWLIVIMVVVVLFCCCFGVIGLLIGFGQDILNELSNFFSITPVLVAVV